MTVWKHSFVYMYIHVYEDFLCLGEISVVSAKKRMVCNSSISLSSSPVLRHLTESSIITKDINL